MTLAYFCGFPSKGHLGLALYHLRKYNMMPGSTCLGLFLFALFHIPVNGYGYREHDSFEIRDVLSYLESGHSFKTLTTNKLKKAVDLAYSEDEFLGILNNILPVRVPGTQGHEDVKNYIINTMESLKWNVELDEFTEDTVIGEITFTNIIVTHNPDAAERLVLACHYDSKLYQNFDFHGMSDSAVPCSMMIELAQQLNSSIWNQRDSKGSSLTLQLLFLDGEEAFKTWTATDSLYGARHLAKVMGERDSKVWREVKKTDLEKINVMILLDLIGTKDSHFKSWFSDTKGLFERLMKTEQRLKKIDAFEPLDKFTSSQSNKYFIGQDAASYGGIQDDHIPFHNQGVKVIHLITYPFPSVWHKQTDNIKNMDYSTVRNINKVLRVFVMEYLRIATL